MGYKWKPSKSQAKEFALLETMDNYNNSLIKSAKIILAFSGNRTSLIDWELICDEFNLEYGDISPEQSLKIDNALDSVNQVVEEFINQNKTK